MLLIILISITAAYIYLLILCAKRVEVQSEFENQYKISREEESSKKIMKRRNKLYDEKTKQEEEAIKIFTLYEITREITKALSETDAFDIFQQKLKEHVDFQECHFFDPTADEIKDFRKRDDHFVFTLKGKSRKIGYLVIKDIAEEDKEKVMILGHQFALALRRVKLYREIERVAITDSLTDVYTRRFVLERLQEEIKRSRIRKINMSFLMIDVDHFKSFNDEYGHMTGDQVLGEIGSIIKENIREIDIPGRFGGEEFCVVLPDTDPEGARFAAERIRRSAEESLIKAYDTTIQATLSIGIATFPKDGTKATEIIDKADWTLYKAKKQGRNRVCSFGMND